MVSTSQRCRLLHVTPLPADHRLLCELVSVPDGVTLSHASTGRLALKLLRERHGQPGSPNLVLLGSRLPDLELTEFLQAVKSDRHLRIIPVIVFCSYLSPFDRETMYEAGAACVVDRPDDPEQAQKVLELLMRLWLEYGRLPL